jgi:hypothetical protein
MYFRYMSSQKLLQAEIVKLLIKKLLYLSLFKSMFMHSLHKVNTHWRRSCLPAYFISESA